MTTRKKLWLIVLGLAVLTVLAGLVDWPKGPDITWNGKLARELKVRLGLDLQGGASLVYQADTSQIAAEDKQKALDGVRDVLEKRINAFGVSEPIVQTSKVGSDYRVIVELPGVTDINKAIKQIGETPILEFKEQKTEYTNEEKQSIQKLNDDSKKKAEEVLQKALNGEDFATLAKDNSQDGSKSKGGDLGCFAKGEMVAAFEDAAFNKAPVGKVYDQLVETEFGWHILKVNEKKNEDSKDKVCAQHILLRKMPDKPTGQFASTGLSGKNLKRAEVTFDSQTNEPEVSLEFDSEGKDLFAKITERNVSKPVAIYLDNAIISSPTVNEAIKDGKAVISGNFDLKEAKELVTRLNAGALPVPITLVNQYQVGPSLGKEALIKSFFAGLIGMIILILFMILNYRWPGFLACLALCIYTLLVLAIFKLWPITLTLAGIAGFILSIGMAVDANVLIFERTKEELRAGKSLNSAIDDGFRRAWLSIRDSNASSLITCLILYWFGTSMIRGFALTLAVGILVSMFSAITITRTFLRIFPLKNSKFYVRLH